MQGKQTASQFAIIQFPSQGVTPGFEQSDEPQRPSEPSNGSPSPPGQQAPCSNW